MITICGSMKKLKIMKNLRDAWKHVEVTIPDDSYYLACSDLIQHRANYLNVIAYSKLVVAVGEWATVNDQYFATEAPILICPAQTGRITMCNALRELGQALFLGQDQIDSKLVYRDEDSYNALPKKTIGECVENFDIGPSTSYEMMWALRERVPVLVLPSNNLPLLLIVGDPDLIFPSKDRIFRCADL